MRRSTALSAALSAVLPAAAFVLIATSPVVQATASKSFTFEQSKTVSDAEWCKDTGNSRDEERFCEVREVTMPLPSTFSVETGNGAIAIEGGARRDIFVRARVVASARSMSDAKSLAGKVVIRTDGGKLDADGPRSMDHSSWWVSYRIDAPKQLNINATASNGSVQINGVTGTIHAETDNGSVRLADIGGDVTARTSNGSVQIDLSGNTWSGAGLSATTSNGSLRVNMPRDYNAHLVAETSNGSMRVDRPVTMQGRIGRDIDSTLGKGGPTIKFRTSNGSLVIGDK